MNFDLYLRQLGSWLLYGDHRLAAPLLLLGAGAVVGWHLKGLARSHEVQQLKRQNRELIKRLPPIEEYRSDAKTPRSIGLA